MFGMVKNPEAQNRVREEIEEVLGDSKKIKFEHLQDMKYMENFINESARCYGIANNLERMCTKEYNLPGTDFVVPVGMYVQVGFHMIFGFSSTSTSVPPPTLPSLPNIKVKYWPA